MSFALVATFLIGYMLLLWALRPLFKNDGLVDFGWPTSFTFLALFFLTTAPTFHATGLIFCSLYVICGTRFVSGWLERTIKSGEDPRWQLWRQRWLSGAGLFRIKSVPANFLAFYLVQQIANLTLIAFSMHINTRAFVPFGPFQVVGTAVWVLALSLESWADFDLWQFKRDPQNKGKVCEKNLWYYSRHPNYFFECLVWVSYVVYSWPAASGIGEHLVLLLLIPMAYWFLVHFTGIPLTEKRSLQSRGDAYARYQQSTNRFVPWTKRK